MSAGASFADGQVLHFTIHNPHAADLQCSFIDGVTACRKPAYWAVVANWDLRNGPGWYAVRAYCDEHMAWEQREEAGR